MTDFLRKLTNFRKFKSEVKTLTLPELYAVQKQLTAIMDAREQEQAEAEIHNAERNARLNAIKKQMAELGLTPADLGTVSVATTKKPRQRRPPKYQIEVNGDMITWTGQGRTPKVFQRELDEGFELSDFLIIV
ncbi:H-NS histone family protein (plasmid) [Shewanella sp. SNU WT4]|uniref:H-NS histone family protein n=1 Tax=Shewanella sp. SNU WT4 TaxID=2590015 RepID=UPI00112C9747|nr:H-NS histone family protein [Shewanella sp. SNU WT4]QDF68685.1 H-NS histone family protein [Shewanella sp. SNU WT4]